MNINQHFIARILEKLTELFRPAPWLDPTLKPVLRDPLSPPVIQQSIAPPLSGYKPIREHAYRAQYGSSKAGRNFSPYDHGRQQFAPHHVVPRENEHVRFDARFSNELEYHNQGLKSFHGQPVTVAPTVESRNTIAAATDHSSMTNVDPYDETTTSLVNRYLSLSRTIITPRELALTGKGSFASASSYASDIRLPAENVRYYPPMLAPRALYGHGHLHQHPGDERGRSSSSVLPRYPFSGPPASRR
ncbi:putative gibberellin receptor GID1B-like isoform 1 [Capsicum annuum]|nr:putative gibberellin receptor GID1B-like isoform 1 [Capsicum annuum]